MSSADKRVSLFLANLKEGGIQRVIVNLARRFTELNLKVDLVVDRAVGPFVDKVCAGIRIVDLKSPRLRKSVSLVANYLKEENPVGIISNMHYNTEIAILAKSLYRLPTHVMAVEHNSLIPGIKPSIKMPLSFLGLTPVRPNNLVRYFYPWADSIVCTSNGVAEDIAYLTGLPDERIRTIYNPVIIPDLTEKAQEKGEHPWFCSPEVPVVLGVGRLVDQ
ncbi:glycosyltransferase, partial [bacterium]|nr:glycosyltransferase [bacterium]